MKCRPPARPRPFDELSPAASSGHGNTFLTPPELADRWKISEKSLSNARWAGGGLPYVKIGGSVRYRLDDIVDYERAQTFRSTSEKRHG